MSEVDNPAGSRWNDRVAAELEASNFGIVCLTPTNLDSRWLNFETGALSKAVGEAHVVPLLHGIIDSDVGPPLGNFHKKSLDRNGIFDTLTAINGALEPDRQLPGQALSGVFDAMWPTFDERLTDLPAETQHGRRTPRRSDRALLEEILELLRSNIRTVRSADVVTIESSPGSFHIPAMTIDARPHAEMKEIMDRLATIAEGRKHITVSSRGIVEVSIPKPEDQLSVDEAGELHRVRDRLAAQGYSLKVSYLPF